MGTGQEMNVLAHDARGSMHSCIPGTQRLPLAVGPPVPAPQSYPGGPPGEGLHFAAQRLCSGTCGSGFTCVPILRGHRHHSSMSSYS